MTLGEYQSGFHTWNKCVQNEPLRWCDMCLNLLCRDDGLHGQSGSAEVSGAQHASSQPRHAAVHVSPSQTVSGREGNRRHSAHALLSALRGEVGGGGTFDGIKKNKNKNKITGRSGCRWHKKTLTTRGGRLLVVVRNSSLVSSGSSSAPESLCLTFGPRWRWKGWTKMSGVKHS